MQELSAVTQWLRSYGGDRHIAQFTNHGYVTLKKCSEIKNEDLITMGISNEFERQRLMRRVADLVKKREKAVSAQFGLNLKQHCVAITMSV